MAGRIELRRPAAGLCLLLEMTMPDDLLDHSFRVAVAPKARTLAPRKKTMTMTTRLKRRKTNTRTAFRRRSAFPI
jgi:hypothetical protein